MPAGDIRHSLALDIRGHPPPWAFPGQFHGQFPQQSWGPCSSNGTALHSWRYKGKQGQPSDPSNNQGESSQQSKNQGKIQQKKKQDVAQKQQFNPGLMSYTCVTCYNFGDPGHHKDKCTKPKGCFICKMINHKVEDCPTRRRPHSSAKYVGGAAQGLGFYH